MKTIAISEAKNGLSALVREVRGGATIVITDRGIPVAQLAPVGTSTGIPSAAIELARRGRLILPTTAPHTEWTSLPFPKPLGAKSAVAALLDERREGR
ncbi:MAG: type II toxin-antitoxin system prevent-host-death family antitoxin [Gemmatimonadaceae bacterium]